MARKQLWNRSSTIFFIFSKAETQSSWTLMSLLDKGTVCVKVATREWFFAFGQCPRLA